MHREWLMFEHERLHQAEGWPECPRRDATITAIASTIAMLELQRPGAATECQICLRRHSGIFVVQTRHQQANTIQLAA